MYGHAVVAELRVHIRRRSFSIYPYHITAVINGKVPRATTIFAGSMPDNVAVNCFLTEVAACKKQEFEHDYVHHIIRSELVVPIYMTMLLELRGPFARAAVSEPVTEKTTWTCYYCTTVVNTEEKNRPNPRCPVCQRPPEPTWFHQPQFKVRTTTYHVCMTSLRTMTWCNKYRISKRVSMTTCLGSPMKIGLALSDTHRDLFSICIDQSMSICFYGDPESFLHIYVFTSVLGF